MLLSDASSSSRLIRFIMRHLSTYLYQTILHARFNWCTLRLECHTGSAACMCVGRD
jgi:hypothetical protein